ncbi:UDP-arabinose 4-epimerase 1 [Glycine max]|nr:UDP-arabinose 4-epimerase 1 [Glycine max]
MWISASSHWSKSQSRATKATTIRGMDYAYSEKKGNFVGKVFLATALTTLCIIMIKRSPSLNSPTPDNLSQENLGVIKVLQDLFPKPKRL